MTELWCIEFLSLKLRIYYYYYLSRCGSPVFDPCEKKPPPTDKKNRIIPSKKNHLDLKDVNKTRNWIKYSFKTKYYCVIITLLFTYVIPLLINNEGS